MYRARYFQLLQKFIRFANLPCQSLILTRGSKGSLIWHNDKWYAATAYPVDKLSDTVGAGDTFMASVLVWLTKNENMKRLGGLELKEKQDLQYYAGKAASLNCKKHGCNPPWENELL